MVVACSSGSDKNQTLKGSGDGMIPGSGGSSSLATGEEGPAAPAAPGDSASPGSMGASDGGKGGTGGTASSSDPDLGLTPVIDAAAAGASYDAGGGPSDAPEPTTPPKPLPPAGAGLLTAGTWDDNRNFERFLGYRSTWAAQGLPGILPISEQQLDDAHTQLPSFVAHESLDISLIIDATGSMGDEIAYLQSEFSSLSNTIAEQYPNSEQRWSLVAYKDTIDEYVVRYFDFRSDTEDFRQQLATLRAGGGGDYPESPERGFQAANQLAWRMGDDAARLAFWVADAPHHDFAAQAMADAIVGMRGLGVHIYPVAASGADDLTELTMRTAAAFTGGRYSFLTNDSGIGNDHKEPTIPCYFVTSLKDAILRMVSIELSGEYREPTSSEIIRTGGNPKDGACKLGSGENVLVY